jgi:hypothetical protein
MRKPIVGETLFSLNVGNSARDCNQVLTPVTVKSVGRKYFTVIGKYGWEIKYHLDTWGEVSDYRADSRLYETEKEWKDEKEATDLHRKIKEHFVYKKRLSLEQLRAINKIMEGK